MIILIDFQNIRIYGAGLAGAIAGLNTINILVNGIVTNLDGLKHRQNIYPSINEHGEQASHPQPSAPPPLPMPNSPNHMYPMPMENSNMFHKHLSEFGNDLNNLDTESVISEPPSYSGVINGGSSHRPPSKPDRKKKGVSIVINNQ